MFITCYRIIIVNIKNLLKRIIHFFNWDPWINISYSQEGEDMVLERIFENKKKGFYVDVGAHHPKRFSNTHLFYKKGWRGINIDAMPGSMKLFNKLRSRDINLEIGISSKKDNLKYYIFNETALNTFSKKQAQKINTQRNSYYIDRIVNIDVNPLEKIIKKYANNKKIDFLNIDAEGLDLDILKSNDWSKYRPKIILVEILNNNLQEIQKNPVGRFMKKNNYILFAKQVNTFFFKDANISKIFKK